MTFSLDWNAIRPLNGSRADGFEELCAQLARAENPAGSRFERKGAPDAGVECYAVLDDGSEWGWQAKYIDSLGEAQWPQIDNSVKTALEKHPRLVRYFICAPLDRPDARTENRRSAMQRWDDHVEKWSGWAADRDMAVEFVWWGSHELIERLSQAKNAGRVRFWFDAHAFDGSWFEARLEEALKTAGPRYTPEIHVDLSIAREFEAFGRTERFFEGIKFHGRRLREKFRVFRYGDHTALGVEEAASGVASTVEAVLGAIAGISVQPTGELPVLQIGELIGAAHQAFEAFNEVLAEREQEYDAKDRSEAKRARDGYYSDNAFRDQRHRLGELSYELRRTRDALIRADRVARRELMVLRGDAGAGKTHLLCDVARQRIEENRPTVLLMGQRFVSQESPWPQALQQLDLPSASAEEFVGALEASAQAAGCRAVVIVDAINEGSGRLLWPNHLASFLAHIARSDWIGVVLSVRTSYEAIVVPEDVRSDAVVVTHHGFSGQEYDAVRTFFTHFGLELPSTPLLAPEFSNPLFLKTLCRGLVGRGLRRLPRGFHGITETFDLYLEVVNDRLSRSLDFNPRSRLVNRAVKEVAEALADNDERWLPLERCEEITDQLLPGRQFHNSLLRGLVSEGVLSEDAVWLEGGEHAEAIYIAYERLADHLIADSLLDACLNDGDPGSAFAPEAPLAFLADDEVYVSPGLLEALCVQLPERVGQELVSLAPGARERWSIGDAFRQSLVWRATTAFSATTVVVLDDLNQDDQDANDTIDVILTVATLPDHPLNAVFLNQRLRDDSLPDRDAWWSTYLHRAWGQRGAVDRLVDWAAAVTPDTQIDPDLVILCGTTLAWMFTSSNRFLRDRATQALANLVSGRLQAAKELVERFGDVDDPYVVERIYAVAYAAAMGSHDREEVGALAAVVYEQVFAAGIPPAHILLRDYARGVVERALFLGADIEIDVDLVRPPYGSVWPEIPAEEDVAAVAPEWTAESGADSELKWAGYSIRSSVMGGDFGRYVIGTNSWSTDWLSLRLDEPRWESPDELASRLQDTFSSDQADAWERFQAAEREVSLRQLMARVFLRKSATNSDGSTPEGFENQEDANDVLKDVKEARDAALLDLKSVLTGQQIGLLDAWLLSQAEENNSGRPPLFDLKLIQRYVLWRVYDLGWTAEKFGHFDRHVVQVSGRDASKAERMGKKYQWIAYHEISALVADHFQYRERFQGDDVGHAYDGPWQGSFRDIDPSCTLPKTRGGTSWGGQSPSWWGPFRYDDWDESCEHREWVARLEDLPPAEDLLRVTRTSDGTSWLNAQGYFCWQQNPPADQEPIEVDRRELWYICTGYLVRTQDVDDFLKWAESVDFWGKWMPEPPEIYGMFLGEHGWSRASEYFCRPYHGDDGWTVPRHGCPVPVRTIAFEYLREQSGFDCSIDDGYTLRLPANEIVAGMGLSWTGRGAHFLSPDGQLVAFDPTVDEQGPNALLMREDALRDFLEREGLAVCWTVTGEKWVLRAGHDPEQHASLRMSGAYKLGDDGPSGFLKCSLEGESGSLTPVATLRTINR